jgi:23S rRNA (uracil1939-C5)-methyltransferase
MSRLIELDIVDLAYNGKSVGYFGGKVTFVNGGLPGETVEALILKSKRRHNQAKLLRIIKSSPERISPICRHIDICGGCTWQDLSYDRQLFYKRNQVIASLKHIGGFDNVEVEDIQAAPERFFYRNKMEYSFHVKNPDDAEPGHLLGLHERGKYDRIFDIKCCHLQSSLSNRLVSFFRTLVTDLNIPAYDFINHRGFLRFVIIREGKNTGQLMLAIVTGEGTFAGKTQLVSALIGEFPELTTIVWIINDQITNIAKGEIREVLHGPGYIEEQIMGLRFQVSPGSFFQTNSRQSEKLYQTAIETTDIKKDKNILDLYCGTGTIGLCAANIAKNVVGIDIETESIETAHRNAEINGIENCRFFCGSVREILKSDNFDYQSFDNVFIDPPRAGMHPKAINQVLQIGAARLIYISI